MSEHNVMSVRESSLGEVKHRSPPGTIGSLALDPAGVTGLFLSIGIDERITGAVGRGTSVTSLPSADAVARRGKP